MHLLLIDGIPHLYAAEGEDRRIWSYNATIDGWTILGRHVLVAKMFSFILSL